MSTNLSDTGSVLSTHEVTITYLEQTSRASLPHVPCPAVQTALMRATSVPLDFYRYMFNAVGEPHKWVSRRYLHDDELAPLIYREDVSVYLLYKDGWPAGFAEVVSDHRLGTEIKFFGLVPSAQGAGLGRWFFHEIVALTWAQNPGKIVIETCTLDSPVALRLYQKMGFSVYDQAKGFIEWRG